MSQETITNVDIIKVGTNSLVTEHADGRETLEQAAFDAIGHQVADLTNPIIVTSAGITAGMIVTGTRTRPDTLTQMDDLQRLSAVGWRPILNAWDAALPNNNTGGMQLTRSELSSDGPERQEALRTIHAMLRNAEVPIVNENDAIAHDEIAFGDNDQLAANLAASIARSKLFTGAVRLFILTSVNGVYVDKDDPSTRIPVITNVADFRRVARDTKSKKSKGGMRTKSVAYEICLAAGVAMWIYNPEDGTHQQAVSGEIGTYFPAP